MCNKKLWMNTDKTEIIAYILEKHALDSKDCLMIGDTKFDIIGARGVELHIIGNHVAETDCNHVVSLRWKCVTLSGYHLD